jgi:hypothetical protein
VRWGAAPRPWSIRLFALLFTIQAATAFVQAITHLAETQAVLEAGTGWLIDRDWTIVITSARLTIALIPIALVWFAASRFARWLVLALALGKLLMAPAHFAAMAPGEAVSPLWLGALALSLGGAALLFTPSAARWFARSRRS